MNQLIFLDPSPKSNNELDLTNNERWVTTGE